MRSRGVEQGAQTLEFVAVLPLLGLSILLAWQGLVLLRQQIEVEADARALARQQAICNAPQSLDLGSIDPEAKVAQLSVVKPAPANTVAIKVVLQPQSVFPPEVLPDQQLSRMGVHPQSEVIMAMEPCN